MSQETTRESAIYAQIAAAASPHIQAYHADLTEHDQAMLAANPTIPFLHWTRAHGTCLQFLFPAEHDSWPAEGVQIPYLFGHAGRVHISNQTIEIARYWVAQEAIKLVQWFDGKTIKVITVERACQVAENYVRQLHIAWARKASNRLLAVSKGSPQPHLSATS
jgi:hypothetical protein